MREGDIIEQYAGSYVVVTGKSIDEAGKTEIMVLDESGGSFTWTDRPNLRTPDRYLKVGDGCESTTDALNRYVERYLQ